MPTFTTLRIKADTGNPCTARLLLHRPHTRNANNDGVA
jgi:hypothetical protein